MAELITKSLGDALRLSLWVIGGIVKAVAIVIYHLRQSPRA